MAATSETIDDLGPSCCGWWAQQGSNLRPLACKASALPLSYAPCGHPGDLGGTVLTVAMQPKPASRWSGHVLLLDHSFRQNGSLRPCLSRTCLG